MKNVVQLNAKCSVDLTLLKIENLPMEAIKSERDLREVLHWICKNEIERYRNK